MIDTLKHIQHVFLFLLLSLMMVFKCWLFADIAHILPAETSIWCQAATWLSWVAISMLIASVVFVARRWWTVLITMTVFDIWFIANVFYYKANQLFISYNVIRMAYNLRGYTDSLLVFFDWTIWIWPLLTILCILPYTILRINKRKPLAFVATWILAAACSLSGALCHYQQKHIENPEIARTIEFFHPLSLPQADMPHPASSHLTDGYYIRRHSLPANLFRVLMRGVQSHQMERKLLTIKWTPEEQEKLAHAFNLPGGHDHTPQGHLILILVESLDGWLFDSKTSDGEYVCKEIKSYMNRYPVLYSKQMRHQILHGVSGDGQMILNTGVLPIYDGAACILYGGNKYPNLAHFYENGVVINPFAKAWNQNVVSYSYGYKEIIAPETDIEWSDECTFSHLTEACQNATTPSCMMAITVATHEPFNRVQPSISLPDSVPEMTNRYLQCLHYTDSCIGEFLHWADTAATMTDATIVIVGDHSIPIDGRDDWQIAFIMRSPSVTQTKEVGFCYQMDLFPTILNAIGQQSYYWRGFGIDLQTQTNEERIFDYESSFYFSDRLIRTNYFATIKE